MRILQFTQDEHECCHSKNEHDHAIDRGGMFPLRCSLWFDRTERPLDYPPCLILFENKNQPIYHCEYKNKKHKDYLTI